MVTWKVLSSGSSSTSIIGKKLKKKQFNKRKKEKKKGREREKKNKKDEKKKKRRCDKGKTLIHKSLELLEGILRNNKAHFFVLVRGWRKAKTQRREEKKKEYLFGSFCSFCFTHSLSRVFALLECYRYSTAHQSLMLYAVIPLNVQ